ncbi:putative reverse transcriptase, RNA-dependent DNA polymerase [Tanacetum coccineum]
MIRLHHHLDQPHSLPSASRECAGSYFQMQYHTSSSRPHASKPKQFISTNVEDDVFGDSVDISPPRSTEAPPAGTTSGGTEDPDKLTALCSLVQKIHSQASDLKAHKLVFKEFNEDDIPPSSSIPSDAFAGGSTIPPDVTTSPTNAHSDCLGQWKSPLCIEEDLKEERKAEKTKGCVGFLQNITDAVGNEISRMVALIAERRRKFVAQRWTLEKCEVFFDVNSKASLTRIRSLLLIFCNRNTRRSLKRPGADVEQPDSKKSKSTKPQKTSIPAASRPSSADVTPDTSKQPSVAPTPPSGFLATPTVTRTFGPRTRYINLKLCVLRHIVNRTEITWIRKMSSSEVILIDADLTTTICGSPFSGKLHERMMDGIFGRKGVHPSRSSIPIEDGDPDADHKMCIKYVSDTDSDSDDDTPVNLHGVVDWELLPTGLGWVNSSLKVNDGSDVWKNQNTWLIQSWKLYSSTGIHVLETVSGHVLHMFVDKRYPLSVNLIERMLEHQLEICRDTVGNELTTAVQLIAFLKKQISDSRRPKLVVNVVFCLLEHLDFWYVVPTGRVIATVSIKVPTGRCDNGTEFKNRVMSEFCEKKGIKKEFSVARTPQQNGVAERRNRTLIEAARTMLADSKLPTTFWAEAVNTACYVQNRVLVVKPHNKTPYELFRGRTPALSFMRPFGCHVTILNTLDYLGKFDGKSDEGFFVGYSMNSKAFRVYNIRTRKVEENLHIRFLEDKPIIAGDGPKWLFDIDVLTKSMNYVPVVAGTNSNDLVGTEESIGAGHSSKETGSSQDYILMPLWKDGSLFDSSLKNASNDEPQPSSDAGKKDDEGVCKESGIADQEKPKNSTQGVNTAGPSINTEPDMFSLGDNATLEATHADFFGDETEVDMSNITTTYPVPSTLNTRIHKDHSLDHVIGDVQSGVKTRRMTKTTNEQGFISAVYEGKTHEDLHTCLFACFLSQEEPKKVWTLVDLPHGKRAIGTKWVYKNKKDERGIVIRNKARLVAQGYTQEEGIDYDEVFAPVARIEAIRLFLAYASFKDFVVYQMDMKSAFLYGKIKEEVYAYQPLGFEDSEFPDRVYKVEKALYGLHQAPKACDILLVQVYVNDIIFGSTKKMLCTEFEKLMHKKFQMSSMGELTFFLRLQVTQKDDGIFICQDEYVDEILKKFGFSTMKTASTPMETSKPLLKDAKAEDVDVHLYRLMIGSLMYLTSLRPDIIYLKGQPKLGLWYPKDSPFDLEAYSNSDYAGASLDKKSTTGGCQFFENRLISWQYKKETVVANSTTEAEYMAIASCYRQVLWIQNQMLDYGYNFMHTKIFIDNESS